jgi:cytochrome c553
MKAIPTAAVCLNCHGTDVQPAVKKAISEYYPDDQAVGYSKGQIRGAFSFTKAL